MDPIAIGLVNGSKSTGWIIIYVSELSSVRSTLFIEENIEEDSGSVGATSNQGGSYGAKSNQGGSYGAKSNTGYNLYKQEAPLGHVAFEGNSIR